MLVEGVLHFDMDIFWHSQIREFSTHMLVQFTVASPRQDSELVNEFSVGWCLLSIHEVRMSSHPHVKF